MKKLLVILALAAAFSFSAFAAENDSKTKDGYEHTEGKWTDISYVNVPILKILEGKDGYVVIYQKNRVGSASVIIPKKWGKGNSESPRKLKFRNIRTSNDAYMTVVKKQGDFKRVIITAPMSKSSSIWGMVNSRKNLEGTDKDTLEELAL